MADYPVRDGVGAIVIPAYSDQYRTVTKAELDASQASQDGAVAALAASTPQFVNAARMHVADVIAGYPPTAALRGKLAAVDDLFGAIDGTLRCGFDGTRYFWQPNGLPEYMTPMTVSGDIVLTALSHPTIIPLSGSIGLGVTRKVTLSTDNAWPGARKRISTQGVSSLLGTLQLVNGLANLLALALGQTYDLALDYSSGTPQWVRV